MNNIEVGEYCRTTRGLIGIVTEVNDTYCDIDRIFGKIFEVDIKAHSKNIIDLIEEGDYVNGYEVMNIYKPRDIWEPIEIKIDSKCTRCFLASEIKSIVTKEQFKEMEYRINE